ncbi:MAG: hypothetical protein HGA36_04390 [Candidatus Moranbacteria bacterium]|nr:hypothetical protein [Candidatus Moranbacteria bacterium]
MCKIIVKEVKDSVSEQQCVQEGICTFAILDRSMSQRPLLYVSTKRSDAELSNLPFWALLCSGGNLNRFSVKLSKDDFFEQIKRVYPDRELCLLK